jgi:glycosyltransferase involved in cell wall biosynthesis
MGKSKEVIRLKPHVSTVIPTRNRPLIVKRSVESALGQTFKELEVIVIIDGPDEATRLTLSEIDDPRLRVVELPINGGAAAARNAGVNEAKGEWIAFLDDDDEWLPQKLESQIEVATRSQHVFPVVTCCLIARTPKSEFVRPRRFLSPFEPLSEYLLARNTLFYGEGLIQTSTLLTKKNLLQKIPFGNHLQKHQDLDWLLRVSNLEGVGIEFVPDPLAIWYVEEDSKSISSTSNCQTSLAWIRENQNLVTPRAYSAFIMVEIGSQASRQREWREFLPLLWEAIRLGKPKPIDFLLYLGMWLIPQETRRSWRDLLKKGTQIMRNA